MTKDNKNKLINCALMQRDIPRNDCLEMNMPSSNKNAKNVLEKEYGIDKAKKLCAECENMPLT